MTIALATESQRRYMGDLLVDREVPADAAERLRERLQLGTITKPDASRFIDWLKTRPRVQQAGADEAMMNALDQEGDRLDAGIYEAGDKIYRVKKSKSGRFYAQVLTYDVGTIERLTANGTTLKAEYEYAPGAIQFIRSEHRVTGARAEELLIVFTNCIVCGRHLKAATSVAAGIGPVCRGAFA